MERNIAPEKRTITFYGEGISDLIWNNIKLTTIRKDDPKYHGFKILESVTGNFERKKRDLLIWGIQESIPLKNIDPVLLALDGFLTIDQAINDLRQYQGYQKMDENSPVTLIATLGKLNIQSPISLELLNKLSAQRKGESLSNVVRNPDIQKLIKPAIAKWFFLRGENIDNWLNFYIKNELLNESKYKEILDYQQKGYPEYFRRSIFENPKTTRYLATHFFHDGWGSQSADRDYVNLYLPFVLGDLSQITKDITT